MRETVCAVRAAVWERVEDRAASNTALSYGRRVRGEDSERRVSGRRVRGEDSERRVSARRVR